MEISTPTGLPFLSSGPLALTFAKYWLVKFSGFAKVRSNTKPQFLSDMFPNKPKLMVSAVCAQPSPFAGRLN